MTFDRLVQVEQIAPALSISGFRGAAPVL